MFISGCWSQVNLKRCYFVVDQPVGLMLYLTISPSGQELYLKLFTTVRGTSSSAHYLQTLTLLPTGWHEVEKRWRIDQNVYMFHPFRPFSSFFFIIAVLLLASGSILHHIIRESIHVKHHLSNTFQCMKATALSLGNKSILGRIVDTLCLKSLNSCLY